MVTNSLLMAVMMMMMKMVGRGSVGLILWSVDSYLFQVVNDTQSVVSYSQVTWESVCCPEPSRRLLMSDCGCVFPLLLSHRWPLLSDRK